MPMTVGQLLDQIRDSYLARFRHVLSEAQRPGTTVTSEAAYRDQVGTLAREGPLGLPMRVDIVRVQNGGATSRLSVSSASMFTFEPIEFRWIGGLLVHLAPLHWDFCDFRVTGIPEPTDWSLICDWFDRWYDGDDANEADEQGFYDVIHFLSDPKQDKGVVTFSADLGSAPMEAFEQLLDALRDSGATKVEVGRKRDG